MDTAKQSTAGKPFSRERRRRIREHHPHVHHLSLRPPIAMATCACGISVPIHQLDDHIPSPGRCLARAGAILPGTSRRIGPLDPGPDARERVLPSFTDLVNSDGLDDEAEAA